jgi:CHAD domain-containing protein
LKPIQQTRVASYALASDDTLAAAARKIIGKQTARMKEHTAGTREGSDPEALHDMRVATRRLRFALRLFGPWMPPGRADRLRCELRRTALVLGRIRDLEVFLLELPCMMDRAGLTGEQKAWITGALRRKRGQGRAVLVRSLRSNRHRRMARALERMPMTAGADVPAMEEAGRMIREAGEKLRAFSRKADLTKQEDLHCFRILFKRLRYTCEYFRDLYGPALDGAIAHFIRFQDCLGKYQDGVVGAAILSSLSKAKKNRDCPYFMDAITKLQGVLREKRGLQREEFSELWTDFPLTLRAFSALIRRPKAEARSRKQKIEVSS